MNKRIKKLWIKALRSDEFRQTKGRLRRDRAGVVRMCCLGVLCDVFHRVTKRGKWIYSKRGWVFVVSNDINGATLPEAVWQWANLEDDIPRLDGSPYGTDTAASLNDAGKDFNYIADRIEKYL